MNQKFLAFVVISFLAGCSSSVKLYEGPERLPSEIALLKGRRSVCNGIVDFLEVDGTRAGVRAEVLPGKHSTEILVSSEPYFPDSGYRSPYEVCVTTSRFKATFETQKGHQYSIFARDGMRAPDAQVIESARGDNANGRTIPAEISLLRTDEQCGYDEQRLECLVQ